MATTRLLHQTIMAVRESFGALRYNTAIARIIELTAHASATKDRVPRALAEPRFTIEVPGSAGEAEIRDVLTAHPDFPGDAIARLVIVPGKIVNIVLRRPDARADHAAPVQPVLREGQRLALRLRPRRAPGRTMYPWVSHLTGGCRLTRTTAR